MLDPLRRDLVLAGSVVLAALLVIGSASAASAQEVINLPRADGAALYDSNCAVCHGAEGQGYRGIISPLAENSVLENPTFLVTYVHLGFGRMPPFP
jgi:mono/diheme cytochrome c family protein